MSRAPDPVAAVLLAAGQGTRLGRGPKALLRRADGTTLVEHLSGVLHEGGCGPVVVVLGAGAATAAMLPGLARHLVAENADWVQGMGSSLRAGLAAVPAGHGALVVLVDQPGVDAAMVRRLLAAHRPGRITAAGFREPQAPGGVPAAGSVLRRGHPVVFGPGDLPAVRAAAHGDVGARDYLAAHPGRIDLVDCSDLSDGGDVDAVADLYRLG
ncbi:nucleotidyltransferase family protein [Micrococcaceae bacterium RIT802]|nr:nucleotidyltransferase family protein [Micrococcaceae bacterium RIT 802]